MFTMKADPQFTHRVDVLVPNGAGHKRESFRATYRVLSTEEAAKHDLSTMEGSTAFLLAAVVAVHDLVDEDGGELTWSDELRDQLFAVPYARAALAKAYFAAINKGAVGN